MTKRPYGNGICLCGCGQKTNHALYGSGKPSRHFYRYIFGHQAYSAKPAYVVDPETDCWVWQRARNKDGYAETSRNGRCVRAHRVFYEEKYGPIPAGLEADHQCDNRSCVNPDHIKPSTHADNSRRNSQCKLTQNSADCLRLFKGVFSQQVVGEMFGVDQTTVSRIFRGISW